MKSFVFPLSGIRKVAADPRVGYDSAFSYDPNDDPTYTSGSIANFPLGGTSGQHIGRVVTPQYGRFANWLADTSFGGALPNRDAIQERLDRRQTAAILRKWDRERKRLAAQHEAQYPIAYTKGYMRDLGRSLDAATGRGVDLARRKLKDVVNNVGRGAFNAANRGAGWLNPKIKSAIKKADSFAR